MKEVSLASKKMLKTINDKYGSVSKYYADKGSKSKGTSKPSGFGSDKIGADGLTGRERASLAGKRSGKNRKKKYVYGKADY